MNLHLGFVADNNDPLKIGRCKVKIIGLYDSLSLKELPWIQPILPLNHEVIFPPIIGAQVICMSLDEHNQTLLMLGQIPGINDSTNSPDNQSRSLSRYPKNRSLVTASGHCIEFDDTPNGERVYIIHKNGSHIKMEPDGSIVLNGNSIEITADSDITLAAPYVRVNGTLIPDAGVVAGQLTTLTSTATVEYGIITNIV